MSPTSAPPRASSWAAPPEFYIDENTAGRSVRQLIAGLGYVVHTPASIFGRPRLQQGLDDQDWLPVVGKEGWAVIGRDWHILDRQLELAAYLNARVHMFLLPGEATRAEIIFLVEHNLAAICAKAVARQPDVYWMTPRGLVDYERRKARRNRRRRSP
jgi:PIN domain-containing protein